MGLPHSKTLARIREGHLVREVMECGSPMPLFWRCCEVTGGFGRSNEVKPTNAEDCDAPANLTDFTHLTYLTLTITHLRIKIC